MNVLLSVIMTVYNGEKHIIEAINSVLDQSFYDFELIVINDGSTDGTAAILNDFQDHRIITIQQENLGAAKSRNKAINEVAKGKYIAILDADDIALRNRFEIQLTFLESNQDYVMIGSNAIIIDEEGSSLYNSSLPTDPSFIKRQLPTTNFFHSAVVYRRDSFLIVGGYNEDIINHIEDATLWVRFSKIGKITNLNEILIKYRLTVNSLTNKSFAAFKMQEKLLHKVVNNEKLSSSEISSLVDKSKLSVREKKSLYHLRLSNIFLRINLDWKLALKNIVKSIYANPLNFSAFKQLLTLIAFSTKKRLKK